MPGFDVKQIKRNDQVILGAGILFLLLSFFAPFYGVSYNGPGGFGGSASVTAWHSYGFLAVLLIIIAVAIVAARVFANASMPALPIGPNLLVVAVSGLGTLLLLLRGFTYKTASGGGYSVGLKWGAWVLYILAIAVVVGAVMNLMASGEKIAWDPTAMNKGGGAVAGGVVPPAAPYPPQGAAPSYPPPADYPPAAGSSETPTV
ncbi:MAG TPA: hypothetical protein VIJ96_19830 [Acidothermaceae bacterium]